MSTPPAGPLLFIALASVAVAIVGLRRIAPPIWLTLVAAAGIRVAFAAMTSRRYTPNDVKSYFHSAGVLVLHGQDPLSHLPGRQWNFLEVMPYIFALEAKTHLAWVYAVKIAPIAADVVLTALVYLLADAERGTRALQYALNPLSLLIVSLHGQVEPVALALAVGGLLAADRNRWWIAGLLVGAAIATKTWPVIFLLALLPSTRPVQAVRLLVGSAVVPVLALTSGYIWLDTHPVTALKHILTYSSLVQNWGWGGLLVSLQVHRADGYNSVAGRPGTILVGMMAIITVVVLRRRTPLERAAVLTAAFLIFTAGFGAQYLLWPVPMMFALGVRGRVVYIWLATGWATLFYLGHPQGLHGIRVMDALSWPIILSLAASVGWLVWSGRIGPSPDRRRRTGRSTAPLPAG